MISMYLAAWLGSVLYGFQTVIEKIISKHSMKNPWLFNAISSMFIFLGTLIISFKFGIGIPEHFKYIIFASILGTFSGTFFLLALYRMDVSVLGPLFCFRSVIAVLVGTLFLGEALSFHQYIMVGVIFVFGILVSIDERFHVKSFFNKGTAIAFLGMIFLVAGSFFVKKSVAENGFWNTTVWTMFFEQIFLLFTIPLYKNDFKKVTKKQYGGTAIVAVFGTLALLCVDYAYSKNVSISTVIISLPISMVIAFICSQFAPELVEKHTLKIYLIRFISAGIMIVAALNL